MDGSCFRPRTTEVALTSRYPVSMKTSLAEGEQNKTYTLRPVLLLRRTFIYRLGDNKYYLGFLKEE